MKRHLVLIAAPFALLIFSLCFLRSWDYGIVNLDDYLYLTKHSSVFEWRGWDSVCDFFMNVEEGIWMPLTWMSYAIDYLIFGNWYGGFHIHSIAIHLINGCLLFVFLRELFCERNSRHVEFLCLAATAIWVVHPLRCESVIFLASRKDVLSFFWELLALICWTNGSKRQQANKKGNLLTFFAFVFFVTGSFCKPSIMTFPLLCCLIDVFIIREIHPLRYIAPVMYMFFLGGFAAWQQSAGGATVDPFEQPLWGRLIGACAAFGIYLRNFVWPQWLAPQCVKTWPDLPRFWLPGLVLSFIWGIWLVRRFTQYLSKRMQFASISAVEGLPLLIRFKICPDILFVGMAWFVVALAPMLGIASFGYHSFADRFTYIPAVGLSIVIVELLKRISNRIMRKTSVIVSFCIAGIFSAVSWRQTGFWKNDYTLFSHTLSVDGDHNGAAHGILANWYFEFPHDLQRAVESFEKALERNIDYVMPCFNVYIIALSESGNIDKIPEAMRKFCKAVIDHLGEERAVQVWDSDCGLTNDERFYRSMYFSCRLAWFLADVKDLPLADEIVSQLKGPAIEKDPIWLYLLMKYNINKGEINEVNRIRNLLLKGTGRPGYIQFRYARKMGF